MDGLVEEGKSIIEATYNEVTSWEAFKDKIYALAGNSFKESDLTSVYKSVNSEVEPRRRFYAESNTTVAMDPARGCEFRNTRS